MGSDKTYIFDGGGTGGGLDIAALVSSMMSNKGMDPNLVAALMNGNNNRGSWGRRRVLVDLDHPALLLLGR